MNMEGRRGVLVIRCFLVSMFLFINIAQTNTLTKRQFE